MCSKTYNAPALFSSKKLTTVCMAAFLVTMVFAYGRARFFDSTMRDTSTQSTQRDSTASQADVEEDKDEIRKFDILPFNTNETALCCSNMDRSDNAALQLQQMPETKLVIDGHSGTFEVDGVALKRARNIYLYLIGNRGVPGGRLIVRTFEDKCPDSDGNERGRVEFYILPAGRQAAEIKKDCAFKTQSDCQQK